MEPTEITSESSPDDPAIESSPNMNRRFGLLGLALVGFALVGSMVQTASDPLPPDLEMRMRDFKALGDDVEVLFVGSSITLFGVAPEQVEASSGLGAFNLGIYAAHGHVVNQVLRYAMQAKSDGLKYVVIELVPWGCGAIQVPAVNPETYWWHTPSETVGALNSMRMDACSPTLVGYHLKAAFIRATGLGLANHKRQPPERETYIRGWAALVAGDEYFDVTDNRRFFKGNPRGYASQVKMLRTAYDYVADTSGYNLGALRKQKAYVESFGVEVIYMIPPSLDSFVVERQLERTGTISPVMNFNRPWIYPEVFESSSRFDFRHLNERGAILFGEILGREIAEYDGAKTTK